MARKLPRKDVVIIGLGWTGSILAHELTDAGPRRGRDRARSVARHRNRFSDFLCAGRAALSHPARAVPAPAQMTVTFRNNASQTALPVRNWGAFMLGNGAGGAGVHWNAETWRFLPTDFMLKSHLTQRYGANFLPADMTIQDWGVTFDDLEPHYDAFEYLCGTSGPGRQPQRARSRQAAIRSRARARGRIRRRRRSKATATRCSRKRRRQLGYKPFPQPSGNLSQSYTNPLGVTLGQCTYCGFCEWFGCANYSKASPQTTILPVLLRKSEFRGAHRMRSHPHQSRSLAANGRPASLMSNSSGAEFEQPADLVLLCAFSAVQRPASAALRHRHALRSADRTRPDRAQFHPSDHVDARSASSTRTNTISIRSSPRARSACASTSSTATISTTARSASSAAAISVRCRPTAGRSRATAVPPGHAGLGLEMETGDAGQLSVAPSIAARACHGSFYSYRDNYLEPRSDLQGSVRPAADAHDHRFSRQRNQDERIPDRQIRRDSASAWAPSRSSSSRVRAPTT